MADTDVLPARGVPFRALVDSSGVAVNGSQTAAQLASRGVRSVCAVDGTGTPTTGGGSLAGLAAAGIRAFCPVDQNGTAQDASTADQLRARGIRPVVLLDASGIALNGSANMQALAQRGLDYWCPVDESGNATTMGAVILISNSTVLDNATIGSTVGVLSVAGGTGTYTFTLTSNPGGLFVTAGTNGVNLNVAAALTAGTKPITVQATGGVPTPVTRTMNITVLARLPAGGTPTISGSTTVGSVLTAATGTWTGSAPITYAYQWKSGGTNVGTNASTYTTVAGDVGSTITVTVTASNVAGSASATAAVGPITDIVGIHAGVGAFVLTGEDMTPTVGYIMPVGTGAFTLTDPGTTQMSPPALTLSLDGQVAGANASTNTLVLPALVTTKTNNVIVVLVGANSAMPSSVVGSTLGAFTQHGSGGTVQLWWKLAPSPLAGEVVTATFPAGTYATGRAVAVNGAKTSAPFDTNASVPNLTGFGAPRDPATITTTAANTMVIGIWRMSAASNPNPGSGFTQIPTVSPGDYYLYEYQMFNTNGLKTVTVGAPDVGGTTQGFIDAIIAGP